MWNSIQMNDGFILGHYDGCNFFFFFFGYSGFDISVIGQIQNTTTTTYVI